MSPYEPEAAHPRPGAAPDPAGPPPAPGADEQEPVEEADEPQEAWAARRELFDHSPGIILGSAASFGGGLVGGDQHGVSGGRVTGDVVMGGKTEIFHMAPAGPAHASGEIPRAELEQLDALYAEGPGFAAALERLRDERVLVLSGGHFTGRRAAALMLLHRLGAGAVRALDPDTSPTDLRDQLTGAPGYVLCDLVTSRTRPLRRNHLLAAVEKLGAGGHLVITVAPGAFVDGVGPVPWEPPPPADVLRAHLHGLVGAAEAEKLLELAPVQDFLGHRHQLREVAGFAAEAARYGREGTGLDELAAYSQSAVESQVQEWLGDPELRLLDKAFLISLAVFDEAPYALTAELGDLLYVFLQETQQPDAGPEIPVFGTSAADRLQLARGRVYRKDEATEWGPVPQRMAAFQDPRTALLLLREVWTGHPSARPAVVRWIRRLAADGRPLVRTRAAALAATLAASDLPSTMALVIQGWAGATRYRDRLTAANALTLAHYLGTPAIPRILHSWCTGHDDRRRWTAIRGYALLGPEFPAEALDALRTAARRPDIEEYETDHLADAAELLLLPDASGSGADGTVLAELAGDLTDAGPARGFALRSFLRAAGRTEDDDGRPLLLAWYERATGEHTEDDRHLTALWRAALTDRTHTAAALETLRGWVRGADTDPDAERALAALLPALAVTSADQQRLGHLLRTLPGADGGPPPPVAARLLAALTTAH